MNDYHSKMHFRLVDLLAVIAVLALLGAFLLPPVRFAGETARLNSCVNNLKQIGLALHNHHDTKKALPLLSSSPPSADAYAVMTDAPGSLDAGYSWLVKILPFMEEAVLYNQITGATNKFSRPAFELTNTPLTVFPLDAEAVLKPPAPGNPHFSMIQIAGLRCPSYAGPVNSATTYSASENPAFLYQDERGKIFKGCAVSNYAALAATHLACMSTLVGDSKPAAEPPNGMLVPAGAVPGDGEFKLGVRFADVTDGLSKTLMVAETREPNYSAWYDGTVNWVVAANPGTAGVNDWGKSNAAASIARDGAGHWAVGSGGAALNVGDEPYPEWSYIDTTTTSAPYPRGTLGTAPHRWTWGPSSSHPTGTPHLFGDGSVGVISADIDPTLYIQLVSRNGGEPAAKPRP